MKAKKTVPFSRESDTDFFYARVIKQPPPQGSVNSHSPSVSGSGIAMLSVYTIAFSPCSFSRTLAVLPLLRGSIFTTVKAAPFSFSKQPISRGDSVSIARMGAKSRYWSSKCRYGRSSRSLTANAPVFR